MSADFDREAETYRDSVQSSISFAGRDVEFFTRRKVDKLLELADRLVGEPRDLRVLDVGCGIGLTESMIGSRFGRLCGVDESAAALASADVDAASVRLCAADGSALPFDGGSFDLAFAICVVHHVAPGQRGALVAEMARVVRHGGLVVVFEHNALNPLTRVAVSRCEFDRGVKLQTRRATTELLAGAGLDPVEARCILFSTSQRRWARRVDDLLGPVPFGAQHYVAARRI